MRNGKLRNQVVTALTRFRTQATSLSTICLLTGLILSISGLHAVEVKRPTADADSNMASICASPAGAVNTASSAMPGFYDAAGTNNVSVANVNASTTASMYSNRVFSAWQAPSGSYSSLVLKVNLLCGSAINSNPNGYAGSCGIQYSTDGGSSWSTLANLAIPTNLSTYSVNLSPSQDLSKLKVLACANAIKDTIWGSASVLVGYDIWTEGTIIVPPLALTTTSLAGATQSIPYYTTLIATGGTAPYTWSVAAGSLPTGLTLNASSGVISGTPTTTGGSSFTVQVNDAGGQTAGQTLTLNVGVGPEVRRPQADYDPHCSDPSSPMPYAYDTDPNSSNTLAISGVGTTGTRCASRNFYNWQPRTFTYTGVNLTVNGQMALSNGGPGQNTSSGTISYSTDAGATWNTLVSKQGIGISANGPWTIALPNGTDPTLVQVKAVVNAWPAVPAQGLGVGTGVISISDIFTTGAGGAITTTTLSTSKNPATYGDAITYTARVSPTTATGSVTFYSGTTALGTASLSNGTAQLTITPSSSGSYPILVVYGGNPTYAASTSGTLNEVVNGIPTSITLQRTAGSTPSTYGNCLTFTATLSPSIQNLGNGYIAFTDNGKTLQSGYSNTLNTCSLEAGPNLRSIVASFSGNYGYAPSTSAALPQTVNQAVTTTTISLNADSPKYGDCITFTATITPNVPLATGNGIVTFTDYSTTLAAQPQKTYSSCSLSAGWHRVKAAFSGNNDGTASSSADFSKLVNQATPIITWNPAPTTYDVGLTSAQLNATANVPGTLAYDPPLGAMLDIGMETLSVTFTPTDTQNYTSVTKTVSLSVAAPGYSTLPPDYIYPDSNFGEPMYEPTGQLHRVRIGNCTRITNSYNSRLQPATLSAETVASPGEINCDSGASGTFLSKTYDFHLGNGDNGNVYAIVDNLDPDKSIDYSYDQLNRIQTAQSRGTDCNAAYPSGLIKKWGDSYTIDAWGNLTDITPTQCGGNDRGERLVQAVNNYNQLSHQTGPCAPGADPSQCDFDASGNYIQSGAYAYDAESRMASSNQGQVTYGYDGDGNRIIKNPGKLYWAFSTMGPLAESDLQGNITAEYIYFDGKRVARIDYDRVSRYPQVHYYFADHLGSASVIVAENGWIEQESEYYPYGSERVIQGSDSNVYKFTGKERDSETGLDHFKYRNYASSMGRWMSADPSGLRHANLADPQSLNLYSYVGNNPLNRVDLDGLCWKGFSWACNIGQRVDNGVHGLGFHTDQQVENLAHRGASLLRQNGLSGEGLSTRDLVHITPGVAGTVRISAAAARKLWEAANPGQKVPFDALRGRYFDMAHIKALVDGGTNAAENLKPQLHDEHMAEHMANGDFVRWATRAEEAAKELAQQTAQAVREGAQDSANSFETLGTEIANNPGEAIREVGTAAAEAAESGEIP
jgi:RHS repeat-associated protein